MVKEIADLLFATGLFSLGIAGAIVYALTFGGKRYGNNTTILTSKVLRKALVDDYRNKKMVARGPLGLIKIMIILGLALIAADGLLQLLVILF